MPLQKKLLIRKDLFKSIFQLTKSRWITKRGESPSFAYKNLEQNFQKWQNIDNRNNRQSPVLRPVILYPYRLFKLHKCTIEPTEAKTCAFYQARSFVQTRKVVKSLLQPWRSTKLLKTGLSKVDSLAKALFKIVVGKKLVELLSVRLAHYFPTCQTMLLLMAITPNS